MGKKSLGRGLNAIFDDKGIKGEENLPGAEELKIQEISVQNIDPNPFQPRKHFKEQDIQELAETILEHGVIQPIVLRKFQNRFQVIAGERRLRACQFLGKETIEAKVFTRLSDKQMAEWAIIENIQRVELTAIEEANSYLQLVNQHGYTHEELSKRLGKSRSAITNLIRLTKLPLTVQSWIEEGKLSAGHARSLLSPEIEDPEARAREIIENKLNVRQAEQKNKKTNSGTSQKSEPDKDPNLVQLEQDLQYTLGTKVLISEKKGKGKIQIDFNSMDDLNRLQNLIRSGQSEHTDPVVQG